MDYEIDSVRLDFLLQTKGIAHNFKKVPFRFVNFISQPIGNIEKKMVKWNRVHLL